MTKVKHQRPQGDRTPGLRVVARRHAKEDRCVGERVHDREESREHRREVWPELSHGGQGIRRPQKDLAISRHRFVWRGKARFARGFALASAVMRSRTLDLAEVRRAVTALLPVGYPTVARTARALGLSARTLQRRLAEAGVGYRQLVQRCRLDGARKLIADSRRGIGQIAAELGYADPSSFSRFFLTKTGTSPRDYRARSRSEARR